MNLIQMLNSQVTPLSAYQLTCRPKKPRSGNPKPQHNKANAARTNKAQARYVAAIGNEWVDTATVSARLGTHAPTIIRTLRKYHTTGLLERRAADGEHTRRKGYEWRVAS